MDAQLPLRFGSAGETYVHQVVVVAMVLVAACIFVVPRRYVIVALLTAIFLIPIDQVLVIGPFHFQMMRILILIGWIRLFTTKFSSGMELFSGGLTAIDKAFILYVLWGALNFVLLWQEWGAVINQLGVVYTSLGIFILVRFFIRDKEDVERTIHTFAFLTIPIAIVMIVEQATGHNLYAYLGGSQEQARMMLMEREGKLRAMGSFTHPILAGVFGAILVPLFLGLWWRGGDNRRRLIVGIFAATVIVMASASSTPVMAYALAVVALCFWPMRMQLRPIRWGIALCLIFLHMIMNAPVWALIGRLGVIGGSDSWHRVLIITQFVDHFWDWWLLGTRDNYNWGYGMWDVTNQYVATAFSGGLFPFICFVAVIVYGFKSLGRARNAVGINKREELFIWALGAALVAIAAAFFGVVLFDQVQVAWCALLGIISVATRAVSQSGITDPERASSSWDPNSPVLSRATSTY